MQGVTDRSTSQLLSNVARLLLCLICWDVSVSSRFEPLTVKSRGGLISMGVPAFGLKKIQNRLNWRCLRWSALETIQFLICCTLSPGSGGSGGHFLVAFPAAFFAQYPR